MKQGNGTCLEYVCAFLAIVQFDDAQDGLAKSPRRFHECGYGNFETLSLFTFMTTFLGTRVSTSTASKQPVKPPPADDPRSPRLEVTPHTAHRSLLIMGLTPEMKALGGPCPSQTGEGVHDSARGGSV